MRIFIAVAMGVALCASTASAEHNSSELWRIGVGGIYASKDIPTLSNNTPNGMGDVSAYGGYLTGGGDAFYKRLKLQVFVDAIFGNSTRNSFNGSNAWLKLGFNIASPNNPLYVNVGIFGDYTRYGSTRDNNALKTYTTALSLGIDGWLSAGERLRWEYSADYDYITSKEYAYSTGANTFAGYYSGGDGSYGLRASV